MNDLEKPVSARFEVRALGKDVLVYSLGNGLLLIFGFLQSLITPKFLPTAEYGYWQLFNLYITYAGILHLGFLDGLLTHWAGKDLSQIGKDLRPAITFLIIQQLAIILPLAVILYLVLQPPFQWIALMVCAYSFIWNLATFFFFITQSIRRFRLLTILHTTRGFIFLAGIFILFISGLLQYQWVIVAALASYLVFTVALVFTYRKHFGINKEGTASPLSYGKKYIGIGIFILLGNFIVFVFWSLDRLLVSNFFSIEQFAFYAFAMSVVNIVLIFIRAIADVFFPHLSAADRAEQARVYQVSKKILIIVWAALLCAYFPLAALIQFYLPNYAASLPVVKIMFGAIGFNSLILIIHVNYFRMFLKQRQYFGFGIAALAIAVAMVLGSIKTFGTLEGVSAAILVSSMVWCIMNELSLKATTGESGGHILKGFLAMICYIAGLLIATSLDYWLIVQLFVYAVFFLIISFIFYRLELIKLLSIVKDRWANKSKRT